MTRKRCCKLLMACGATRNEANQAMRFAHKVYNCTNYECLYLALKPLLYLQTLRNRPSVPDTVLKAFGINPDEL
jgi:hypothetical protein